MDEAKSSQGLLMRLVVLLLGTWLAAEIARGIEYDTFGSLLLVAMVLAVLNAFVRPLLIFFALPLVIFTLGLGVWLINALLLLLAAQIVPGFHVESFGSALWGAFIIGFTSMLINAFTARDRIHVRTFRSGPRSPDQAGMEGARRLPPRAGRASGDDVIDV